MFHARGEEKNAATTGVLHKLERVECTSGMEHSASVAATKDAQITLKKEECTKRNGAKVKLSTQQGRMHIIRSARRILHYAWSTGQIM